MSIIDFIMKPRADIFRLRRLIVASKPNGTSPSISFRALVHLSGSAVAAMLDILSPSNSVRWRRYVLGPSHGSIPIRSVKQAGTIVGMVRLFVAFLGYSGKIYAENQRLKTLALRRFHLLRT